MNKHTIPAEDWDKFSSINSCQKATEHNGKGPLPVKFTEFRGFLYTSFATMWSGFGIEHTSNADCYKLIPESLYEGETFIKHHDEEAIAAGIRSRGNHIGLIVSVRGQRLVCAERVQFCLGLPTTKPITQAEAEKCNLDQESSGWRALFYKGCDKEWFSLNGHPVVRYYSERGISTSLFWRKGRIFDDLRIANDVSLEPALAQSIAVPEKVVKPPKQLLQLSLAL